MSESLESLRLFLLGAVAMGDLLAGLFFLRYWKETHDRLFLYFTWSFGVEVICRIFLIYTTFNSESEPLVYSLRVVSYGLILVGIVDKNRTMIRKIFSHT